jgi:hypothetical protein
MLTSTDSERSRPMKVGVPTRIRRRMFSKEGILLQAEENVLNVRVHTFANNVNTLKQSFGFNLL